MSARLPTSFLKTGASETSPDWSSQILPGEFSVTLTPPLINQSTARPQVSDQALASCGYATPSAITNSYSSAGSVFGLLPPTRKLPEVIRTLPSPNSPVLLSISTTLAPCSQARTAAVKPAKPAPTTSTSQKTLFIFFPVLV